MVELKCHGAASPQGVGSNEIRVDALLVQFKSGGGFFDRDYDGCAIDGEPLVVVECIADELGFVAVVLKDVMNASC